MTTNEREFLRLLGVYTGGRFVPWALAGPAKASRRAHVMSALAGARVPQSRAGITAIEQALFSITQADGSCLAVREDNAAAKAARMLSNP